MKNSKILIFYLLIFCIICNCNRNSENNEIIEFNKNSLEGYWATEIKNEKYIFMIEKDVHDNYRGVIATYRGKYSISNTSLEGIKVNNLNLSMITNPKRNITFIGSLDTTNQMIYGNLHYKSGSKYQFNLKRYSGPECYEIKNNTKFSNSPTFKYKSIKDMPTVKSTCNDEVNLKLNLVRVSKNEKLLNEKDIIAVINRWQGDIFPTYENRSSALLMAFLLDPVTKQISDQMKEAIKNCSNTKDKVAKLGQWTTENLTFTQIEKQFSNLPGKDPWGTMQDGISPTFKKLIPSEMKAMQVHVSKMSGKCFTLVNLISSCFIQLGVDPDDIVCLIKKDGEARHALALIKYEGEILLINLMLIDFLKNHIDEDFGTYEILGIYNQKFSQKTNFGIRNIDLQKLAKTPGESLIESFINCFELQSHFKTNNFSKSITFSNRELLWVEVFNDNVIDPTIQLTKYAYQSLYVENPRYYLSASLNASGPRVLAKSLKSEDEIFNWIKAHIRFGSIFPDSNERIMTADQVLVFQQGSYKDQAVLAFTLLKHLGITSKLHISKNNAYVSTKNKIYDMKKNRFISKITDEFCMELVEH